MKPTILIVFLTQLMFTSPINAQEEKQKTAKRVHCGVDISAKRIFLYFYQYV